MKVEHSVVLRGGIVCYDTDPAIIVATQDRVQINCTVIDIDVLQHILKRYEQAFPKKPSEIVIQNGNYPMKY